VTNSQERPDWRRMHRGQFHARNKVNQDALFLEDESDSFGTEAFEGFGFGATLFGDGDDAQETRAEAHQ
jgi:hypothetical protein